MLFFADLYHLRYILGVCIHPYVDQRLLLFCMQFRHVRSLNLVLLFQIGSDREGV
jgi:hypothetical protein